MKQRAALICAAVMLALPAFALAADQQPAPQPTPEPTQKPAPQKKARKVIAELVLEEAALVKAVDLQKRTVTLETSTSKDVTIEVDKRVKKLDQVKVGDTVKVTYYEAVSVRPMKVKTTPGVIVEEAATRDQKSVKPAGAVGRQVTVIATIEKIHDNGKWVTLKGPEGNTVDVKVRDPENVAKLKKGEIKVGDQVEITYTQALAISVEKVEAAK